MILLGFPDLRPLGLFFTFLTDFTNITIMLLISLDILLIHVTTAHCTQVSDQGLFGLWIYIRSDDVNTNKFK